MQDFELESLTNRGDHSQKVKTPLVVNDYGSKDCVNLPSSTAFSRIMSFFDSQALVDWFLQEKRDLPWRNTPGNSPTPYAVWISEVMLQQTQVAVVIPYFERWMKRFPDVKALADAPLNDVIKQWEGLGYYSRARHLHEGAKFIMQQHEGIIPSSFEALKQIKGLGPYTIGAILSFAFRKKAAAVDGNVLRVLARYFSIEKEISQTSTIKEIRNLAEKILPEEDPWIVSEALIELGALICTKNPQCLTCPLKKSCSAFLEGKVDLLPIKKKRAPPIFLFRHVAIIHSKEHLLVRKGKPGELMQDLHEFPYFESSTEKNPHPPCPQEMTKTILEKLDLKATYLETLPFIKHTFTKYRVELAPMRFQIEKKQTVPGYLWIEREALTGLAFSSGHKRLFDSIRIA